jgi:hypothetical protein
MAALIASRALLLRALKIQSTITMGVLSFLRSQSLSKTNQSSQKQMQWNSDAELCIAFPLHLNPDEIP